MYDLESRRTNGPFVGPQSYNQHDSYKKMKAAPCLVKMASGCERGNDGFTMIGNQKVYAPAFEKEGDRKTLENLTQDKYVMPKSPVRNHFNSDSLNKLMGAGQPLLNSRMYRGSANKSQNFDE